VGVTSVSTQNSRGAPKVPDGVGIRE
jgi:hypothetical protein